VELGQRWVAGTPVAVGNGPYPRHDMESRTGGDRGASGTISIMWQMCYRSAHPLVMPLGCRPSHFRVGRCEPCATCVGSLLPERVASDCVNDVSMEGKPT
jgi:hypothetical protein